MIQSTKMTNLQLELLKVFSWDVSESELLDIKRMLADYFYKKLAKETGKIWDEHNLTDDDMDRWLKELS